MSSSCKIYYSAPLYFTSIVLGHFKLCFYNSIYFFTGSGRKVSREIYILLDISCSRKIKSKIAVIVIFLVNFFTIIRKLPSGIDKVGEGGAYKNWKYILSSVF
ncbi:hypothetical protein BX661DRAFT_62968 [Kickxella alabastrina]|uniref:uncharacterized protein n=1 Tax=Kickxella alabastrina TaxID=61397 RepID=UPI002220D8B6|nr:uncharacterized protein BX661DRAFT_62968 [Kickxella alabastrina]KAI7821635.1 hypothetical protein BX661DRAFT_62968 [Kickxella alabastrina]